MIGYIKDSHSQEPLNHEWQESGETHYRSICSRWTVLREHVVQAAEVNCQWCLSRRRHRQEAGKPKLLTRHRREIQEAIEESKRGMQCGMGSVTLSRPLIELMLAIIDSVDQP